jgi:hypothetical protein
MKSHEPKNRDKIKTKKEVENERVIKNQTKKEKR